MARPPTTLPPPITVPIVFVNGMLSGVRARGLPCDAYLADAGIEAQLLEEGGARVTADQYVALFGSLTERLDDDSLGFLSRPLRRGSFALITRSAASEVTLEAALRRAARTFGLLQDDVVLEPVRAGSLVGMALRFTDSPAVQLPFLHEMLMCSLWRLFAWLAGGRLPAAGFDFAFDSPPYAGSYGKVFPAALHFRQRHSACWFEASLLQQPVRRDAAAVRAFLANARVNLIIPNRADELVGERVRRQLQRCQPDWPDLATTAKALHISPSTLQRRLALDGTSFQSLKDELRRDLAIVRLNTSSEPLAALAYDLGFADSAAFQRAFKNWTGSAPGAYRRGLPGV